MAGIKIGVKAKLKQPVVQGVIEDTEFDKESGELKHLLIWKDEAGEPASRWFLESQLEKV